MSGALNSAVEAGSEVQPGSVLTWTTGGETVCLAVTTLPEPEDEEEGEEEEAPFVRGGGGGGGGGMGCCCTVLSEMERLRELVPTLCVVGRPITWNSCRQQISGHKFWIIF